MYRIGVGIVGGLLLILAPLTGWLPGPGGIPLFIAGLAVLASEFEWAQVLMRVKEWAALTHWTNRQPGWLKALGTVALMACVLLAIWGYLAVLGVPGWLPDSWETALHRLLLDPGCSAIAGGSRQWVGREPRLRPSPAVHLGLGMGDEPRPPGWSYVVAIIGDLARP